MPRIAVYNRLVGGSIGGEFALHGGCPGIGDPEAAGTSFYQMMKFRGRLARDNSSSDEIAAERCRAAEMEQQSFYGLRGWSADGVVIRRVISQGKKSCGELSPAGCLPVLLRGREGFAAEKSLYLLKIAAARRPPRQTGLERDEIGRFYRHFGSTVRRNQGRIGTLPTGGAVQKQGPSHEGICPKPLVRACIRSKIGITSFWQNTARPRKGQGRQTGPRRHPPMSYR
jgi:hypothetical protein